MECRNCDQGNILLGIHFISHEMAMDAGDMRYEGQPIEEFGACPCCRGGWQDCLNCATSDNTDSDDLDDLNEWQLFDDE